MGFLKSAVYFLILGVLSFAGGRLYSDIPINENAFFLKAFPFEKDGKIYKKIGITKWQSHVPDMSRIFYKIMPAKKIEGRPEPEKLAVMIKETCIAEITHWILILLGIGYLFIWPGIGGVVCFILSIVVNLVFIVIQRYNRPRLIRVLERKTNSAPKEKREKVKIGCGS